MGKPRLRGALIPRSRIGVPLHGGCIPVPGSTLDLRIQLSFSLWKMGEREGLGIAVKDLGMGPAVPSFPRSCAQGCRG